ncbi:inactive heparanase-2-like [Bufo gargarizans]|uniref:inactive heparanase-2-like n=1 Tax=Bufo gargarizans TaxID=30331 RepID=UPI001CF42991|nr:inactive heparanase-2-like [Bufo gargarizans]
MVTTRRVVLSAQRIPLLEKKYIYLTAAVTFRLIAKRRTSKSTLQSVRVGHKATFLALDTLTMAAVGLRLGKQIRCLSGRANSKTSGEPKLKYDAVIVGGGHNGLVAAAYLQKSGVNCVVLERRHVIGGAAVTEEIIPENENKHQEMDYWLSLLFKRLVGPKVLAVHVAGIQRKPRPGKVIRDKLRIYAHCTSHHNHNYVRGSITLYIINLHRSRKKIKLAGTLRDKIVHQYLLQPYGTEGIQSKSVQLNGQRLLMIDDGTLPDLKLRPLRPGRTLVIPPLTIGFYVVKNVNAVACRYR